MNQNVDAPHAIARPPAPPVPPLGLTPRMLNHAAWVTQDVAATARFYPEVLGMEIASTILDDKVPSTGDAFPYFQHITPSEFGAG